MSSEAVDAQKQTKKLFEKAVSNHCYRHYLNLVITTALILTKKVTDICKE